MRPAVISVLFLCLLSTTCCVLVTAQCGAGPFTFNNLGIVQVSSTDNRVYILNPCAFLQPNGPNCCQNYANAYACATWNVNYVCNLGSTSTWSLISNNDPSQGVMLLLGAGRNPDDTYCKANNNVASATVFFVCISPSSADGAASVTSYGSTTNGCNWQITVNSLAVCQLPTPPPPSPPSSSSGISGGWVFIIILLVVTFVYCVAGVLFMRFRRHAVGMEMMPNYALWREVPGLVKDGCRFTWGKIRSWSGGMKGGADSYKSC